MRDEMREKFRRNILFSYLNAGHIRAVWQVEFSPICLRCFLTAKLMPDI